MHGYAHQTIYQMIGFVYVRNGAHTYTIESTWRHVKTFLKPYNRMADYVTWLATCLQWVAHPTTSTTYPTSCVSLQALTEARHLPPALVTRRRPIHHFKRIVTHIPLKLWITVPHSEAASILTPRVSIRNYYTYHCTSQNLPPPQVWSF